MFSEKISKNVEVDSDDYDSDDKNSKQPIAPSYLLLEMLTLMTLYVKAAS
jgi:hypothetical protein